MRSALALDSPTRASPLFSFSLDKYTMGISTYNFFDFESQEVVVYFSMILIVTYIMQRRRERRIDRKTQSYLPQLKALAADPNKVREPGGECSPVVSPR